MKATELTTVVVFLGVLLLPQPSNGDGKFCCMHDGVREIGADVKWLTIYITCKEKLALNYCYYHTQVKIWL